MEEPYLRTIAFLFGIRFTHQHLPTWVNKLAPFCDEHAQRYQTQAWHRQKWQADKTASDTDEQFADRSSSHWQTGHSPMISSVLGLSRGERRPCCRSMLLI